MNKITIIGIRFDETKSQNGKVQEILTSFGCSIRTRLGLNNDDYGQNGALVILELSGEQNEIDNLIDKLENIKGVDVQKMIFA